jgi:nucleoside-diphosphate-sugar epimerase
MAEEPRVEAHERRRFEGRTLVTGVSTHLGANMAHRLLAEGRDVRVLLHRGERSPLLIGMGPPAPIPPAGVEVEKVQADLVKALKGVETVYCCEQGIAEVRNLLEVAGRTGVGRVIVASRLGSPESMEISDECSKAVAAGLDVMVALAPPTIGPHDFGPTREGKMLLDYAHGRLLGWIAGNSDLASVADVCEGMMLAIERGRTGTTYAFTTERTDAEKILHLFEEVSGRQRPKLKMPSVMATVASKRVRILHLGTNVRVDSVLAQEELGYRPTSIRKAIHEAYADFAKRGLVPRAPSMSVSDAPDTSGAVAEKSAQVRTEKVGVA